jgi:transposase
VWAWVVDCNRMLRQWRYPPVVSYRGLCREPAGMGAPFGELSATAARSVLRRYSDAWFEAAKRVGQGRPGGFPRRKRALMPLRWYAGTFTLTEGRLRLSVAAGRPPLVVRLARPIPYPAAQVRAVTLVVDGGRLAVDVTAEVPVQVHDLDPDRVAGVDMGVIHPYAVVSGPDALLVSGRAARAEHHLHLADTKARARAAARRAPKPGQRGSRRWRQARRAQRHVNTRHRRRIRHGQHHAATLVVEWAVTHRVATLVVGDPKGITQRDLNLPRLCCHS